MKKILLFVLTFMMIFTLISCGGVDIDEQLIIDAINESVGAQAFKNGEELYKQFTKNDPSAPKVRSAVRLKIDDLDGAAVDCYLVTVSCNLAYWINEAEYEGSIVNYVAIYIDAESGAVYDSFSTNAMNIEHDTKTEMGRITYLLKAHMDIREDLAENYWNSNENVGVFEDKDIEAINKALN